MSRIPRFAEYAAAFEKSFATDDWSFLEPFFTDDAVYDTGLEPPIGPPGGRVEGRAEILAWFEESVARLDRRFESRELNLLEGPTQAGDVVRIRGNATYRAAGVPEFVLELEERVHFTGDRISLLEDRYTPEMKRDLEAYVEAHGEKLGISLDG